MTCNDVIRNFRKKNEVFVALRHCRVEDQEPWPVRLHLARILLKGGDIKRKTKSANV